MPYEFQVLCCYACETFQVHQVKKAKKWECKVCGAKQSLIKAFKIGNPRECRQIVQQLNIKKGLGSEKASEAVQQTDCERTEFENNFFELERNQNISESEEEELVPLDCENRSPTVPGLEPPNNKSATETHQPSTLQNTLQAFYCTMSMNSLEVRKTEKSGETETISLGGASALVQEGAIVDFRTVGRKNRGFEMIKEAAKRRKMSSE